MAWWRRVIAQAAVEQDLPGLPAAKACSTRPALVMPGHPTGPYRFVRCRKLLMSLSTTGGGLVVDFMPDYLSTPLTLQVLQGRNRMSDYDVIIVGGGSAGATLAARLSGTRRAKCCCLRWDRTTARPQHLLRSGVVMTPGSRSMAFLPRTRSLRDTSSASDLRRTSVQTPTPLLRGRGMGGSSAVNGMFAIRPTVEDLDGWSAAGAQGWSFDETLPLLMQLESDRDFGSADYHGTDGPIPIVRPAADDFLPIDEAFRQAALEMGHASAPDHNAPRTYGISPYAYNAPDSTRVSTNDGYLEPARNRGNLRILGDTCVDRVLFAGGRAVEFARYGQARRLNSDRRR